MFGAVSFHGFSAVNGSIVPSPPPFSHVLEVIGDSISAGYGNDGCPFSAETEIGSAAYGPLAARTLGAVAQVMAWSGRGMVMDLAGNTQDQLPSLYQYAIATGDSPVTWDYSDVIPDAVVINLGTNDFSGGVNRSVFISTYETFVTRLRGYYPNAYVLLAINDASDAFSGALDTVISNLADPNVEKINLESPNWNGCDGHPNLAAHQAMANTLANRLKTELGW
ncbi:MAG: SGNH/GDSL hydrolase family protein [Deltaproteobacteria bacterium]|nr:SGNH/GDSL hydrolase family protein [Deltaproteobacteria bacterium]